MKNNGFPSKEIVDRLRRQYPKGISRGADLHERSLHEAEARRSWDGLYGG